MAKVYFWSMSRDGFGHLSLQLSDGTYISHWPNERSGWKKGSNHPPTLDSDIELEGRRFEETLDIPAKMIDESRIIKWWKEYYDSGEYNVVMNNCGQVVRRALVQGGIEETIPWYHKYLYYGTKWIHATLTPHDCLAWIKYIINIH